jgi:hypothetical protein
VCRPWQQEADHYRALEAAAEHATGDEAAAAEAALTPEAVDRWLDLEDRLHEHRGVLHGPLRFLPEDARLLAAYADPPSDTADGRAVYREPPEGAGLTERSKAFFLLNRHRLSTVVAASRRPRWATCRPTPKAWGDWPRRRASAPWRPSSRCSPSATAWGTCRSTSGRR